jgi:hypothetical protein
MYSIENNTRRVNSWRAQGKKRGLPQLFALFSLVTGLYDVEAVLKPYESVFTCQAMLLRMELIK